MSELNVKIKLIADNLCTPKNEILQKVTLLEVNEYLQNAAHKGYELCQKEYEEKLRWIPVEESKPEKKEEQYQIQVLNRKNDIQVIWFGSEYDLTFINRFKAWRYFL